MVARIAFDLNRPIHNLLISHNLSFPVNIYYFEGTVINAMPDRPVGRPIPYEEGKDDKNEDDGSKNRFFHICFSWIEHSI